MVAKINSFFWLANVKKIFSSETAWPNGAKLGIDGPWVCPFQNCVRQPHPPFKMAAVFKGNDYLPLKFASVSFYCQVSDTGSVGWASSSYWYAVVILCCNLHNLYIVYLYFVFVLAITWIIYIMLSCKLRYYHTSLFSLTFSKKKNWAIVVTPASGSVKFFVRVHFSKTIKGIHLKLWILVHYQKRNQLQQGRWPCDFYIQSYLPLFRHST